MNKIVILGGTNPEKNTDVKEKINSFITFLKGNQDNNTNKNNILDDINKEITLLVKKNEISETKQEYLFDKLSKLKKLDDKLLVNITEYQKGLASHEKKSGIKPLLDLKYELFKLQVNSLRLLLQKFNLSSNLIEGQFKDLLDITRQKIEIANEIISQDFDENKMSPDLITKIDKIVDGADVSGINGIEEQKAEEIKGQIKDFINQAPQRGGSKGDDLKSIINKFNLLFSFFKTDLLLKTVFLAGYFNDIIDEKIKDMITRTFKFYFIENTETSTEFYKQLSEKVNFDFDKFINETNKTYSSIYGTTSQIGGFSNLTTQIIKLKLFGGQATNESVQEKANNVSVQEKANNVSVQEETKKYIFIPVILGMIIQLQSTHIDFLLSKDGDIEKFLQEIILKFSEFLNSGLYTELKNNSLLIDESYKKIIDDKKVVFTYIKQNEFTKPNKRFDIKSLDKPSGSIIELNYKENNNTVSDDDTFIPSSTSKFYLGPFDKYYKNTDNEDVAKDINSKIKSKLLAGETYCIIGYGQSGSGKTSTLIQLQLKNENKDGVLLELLKDNDIKNNYDVTISGKDIRTTYVETATGEDRYDLADLPLHEYSFNEEKQNWLNKNVNVIESDANHTLPGYIIQKIDSERPIFPTPNNIKSSRSHMIIKIEASPKNSTTFKKFVLFVCDLAGFENQFKCGNGIEIERFFKQYQTRLEKNDPEELFDRKKCTDMKLYTRIILETI